MAELYPATRASQRHGEERSLAVDGAHRGSLDTRGLTPGARVLRRPAADGAALLHQFGVVAIRPGGTSRIGGLQPVPGSIQEVDCLHLLAIEDTDSTVQAIDRCAKVLAGSGGQLAGNRHFL